MWYQAAIAHALPRCSAELQTHLEQIWGHFHGSREQEALSLKWEIEGGHQSEMQTPISSGVFVLFYFLLFFCFFLSLILS